MTEFQLLMLRRLDGAPRCVAGLWLRPEDVRQDPALAERAYWMSVRDENRGLYDFLVSAPLRARRRRVGPPNEELPTTRRRKLLAFQVRYYGIATMLAPDERTAGSATDTTSGPNHNDKAPRHG